MRISHVRQPKGSYLCGQACVAMVLGLPDIESACRIVGHSRKTWTKEIVRALGPVAASRKLSVARKDLGNIPDFCILRSRWGVTRCAHVSVYRDGHVYEPLLYGPVTLEGWLIWLSGDSGRVTSFLPLVGPPEVPVSSA